MTLLEENARLRAQLQASQASEARMKVHKRIGYAHMTAGGKIPLVLCGWEVFSYRTKSNRNWPGVDCLKCLARRKEK